MISFQPISTRPNPRDRLSATSSDVPVPGPSTSSHDNNEPGSPLVHDPLEHNYVIRQSPRKLKRKLDLSLQNEEELKKKIKHEQTTNSRLRKKVKSLKEIVQTLKKKNLVTDQCATLLESTFTGVSNSIMQRILKQNKNKNPGKYSNELRSFAMTLNFYSAKAYRFVRKTFQLALPHPAVIRKWYHSIQGDPGFTTEVFAALRAKVLANCRDGQQTICGLLLDEMSIKRHIEWDGKRFRGFVDLGTELDDDAVPAAKDALVLMVVCLNGSWKVPCGYFLIDSLTGEEKANLVKTCIQKLFDVGVKIRSLTCDGPSAHFSMFRCLGAGLDPANLMPWFLHPSDKSIKVCIFLDPCHMLKLVRNTLADLKVLKQAAGELISWKFLEDLHAVQEKEGLRLGNKLRSAHINWRKQKMKVNLAAQSLSSSVADALVFCREHLYLPEFAGCDATVNFILIFDRLFDIFNSRNPLAKGYKAPLRSSNFSFVDKFLCEAEKYIMALRDSNSLPILHTRRKTGFLGFLICIKSLRVLVQDLLMLDSAPIKYLLTYKLSQDHLELFFCAVRGAGGFRNNPTATQFAAAYRRLLMRHQIEGGSGNCTVQDETHILHTIEQYTQNIEIVEARKYGLQIHDHDNEVENIEVPQLNPLSEYKEAAISYMAGYVVRMMVKKIACSVCIDALFETDQDVLTGSVKLSLVHFKDRGGLFLASPSVIFVCQETEQSVQRLLSMTNGKLPTGKCLIPAISTSVLERCLGKQIFQTLTTHMLDSTPTTNHVVKLVKCCIECFLKIRLHHLAKQYTEEISGEKIRKLYSKLILFKHQ